MSTRVSDRGPAAPNRVAVDIGGTFTDVVVSVTDPNAAGAPGLGQFTSKVLTTHDDPALGVMSGLDQAMRLAGVAPSQISLVLHGTTLATNALIERRGAKTALLTTQGHRDAVEMAYENRFEQYDISIDRPKPLVPRRLRLGVTERLNAAGDVLVPLDLKHLDRAIGVCADAEVESIAVGFLHAYANPAHELATLERLSAALPDVAITLASQVCPEIREYERVSTACANAYVKPLMGRYLRRMADSLSQAGFGCPLLMMTSGGGLTSLATAAEFPIRLVESGPAGGAILAGQIARRYGAAEVISFDMGGTTAKICLIDDGEPQYSRAFEVDRSYRFKKGSGLPVRIPVIEMVEIGAGGGSIASVDRLQRIQVGPESAGSDPGPACYGRGGRQPTVTDADVVMARIDARRFAGGSLALDPDAAQRAVAQVGTALGAAATRSGDGVPGDDGPIDASFSAFAISEVVDENMAAATRAHAVEWGRAAQGRTLIAFGGAAPLHAAQLALKLGLPRVIIPGGAGVGSALGFLAAPVSYEVVRSRYLRLSSFSTAVVEAVMAEMEAEAEAVIRPALFDSQRTVTRKAFMRYVGQGYEIAVTLPDVAPDEDSDDDGSEEKGRVTGAELRARFDETYQQLYGRVIPGLDVEVLSWTLTLSGPRPALGDARTVPIIAAGEPVTGESSSGGEATTFFDPLAVAMVPARRVDRASLPPDEWLAGPLLVVEEQTTTVVNRRFRVRCNRWGDLELADTALAAAPAPMNAAGVATDE